MADETKKENAVKKCRKVFLSVLGTSFYEPCVYQKGDFTASETRFIQRASLEYCGAPEWESSDCVCIFLTDDARTNNWTVEGNARARRDGESPVPYRGLKDELEGMGLRASLQGISIPDGSSEDEIWKVFSCMYGALQDGDEVYLDITHGLRYLPMLAMVLLSYAKFLRHIKVRDIIYGYWNRDSRTAEIVSLLPLSGLQDWTSAADQLISAGSAGKLSDIYLPEVKRISRDAASASKAEGRDISSDPVIRASSDLQGLINSIRLFENEQLTCFGKDVVSGRTAESVRDNLEHAKGISSDTLPVAGPLIPLFDKIGEAVDGYKSQSIRNIFLAAADCCRHGNYQQAITSLQEGIVTFVADKFGLDWGTENGRKCVNNILNIIANARPESDWEIPGGSDSESRENRAVMLRMYDSPAVRAIAGDFAKITDCRNQYNHCGMLKNSNIKKPKDMLERIKELVGRISYESLEEAFRVEIESVFVNFTNHPSEKWSMEQLSAARAIGTVKDLKFPDIPTDIDRKHFDRLVHDYRNKILELCWGRQGTVHIQGEMTFVFRMVTELKARHIRCVASVTKRNTVDLGNGKSQSVFVFEGFRDY